MKTEIGVTGLAFLFFLTVMGSAEAQSYSESQYGHPWLQIEARAMSQYVWRGFDMYPNDKSAYRFSGQMVWPDTGLGAELVSIRSFASGFESQEEFKVRLFKQGVWENAMFLPIDYRMGWTYHGYPEEPRGGSVSAQVGPMQEIFFEFLGSPIAELWPRWHYEAFAIWPSEGDSVRSANAGWGHIIGLVYDMEIPGWNASTPETTLQLSADLAYNDGWAPGNYNGATVDHDWSHMLFGASTDIVLLPDIVGFQVTLTPSVYTQLSMDDSVNSGNEFWATLNLQIGFE